MKRFVWFISLICTFPCDAFLERLGALSQLAIQLKEKNLLDGELLITDHGQIVAHICSDEVARIVEPQYMIASVSKQFTAVVLLLALYETSSGSNEEEKSAQVLSRLQRPLAEFLPDLPEPVAELTLHQLLTHTSGLPNPVRLAYAQGGFDALVELFRIPNSPFLRLDRPLDFTPGSQFAYSNRGYELLSEVIVAVSQMSFPDYSQKLFASWGLRSTYQPAGGRWYEVKQNCSGLLPERVYSILHPEREPVEPDPERCHTLENALGSGGIVSSAHDLFSWQTMLHSGLILPNRLYEVLITPHYNAHCYGMRKKADTFYCTGKWGSYVSLLVCAPKEKVSIVVLGYCDIDPYEEHLMNQEAGKLDDELRSQIEDDQERFAKVQAIFSERYPKRRGVKLLLDKFFELIDNPV